MFLIDCVLRNLTQFIFYNNKFSKHTLFKTLRFPITLNWNEIFFKYVQVDFKFSLMKKILKVTMQLYVDLILK